MALVPPRPLVLASASPARLRLLRDAGFAPTVVVQVSDIFSLMNLVSAGLGYTLLPGRVRDVFGDKIQLIPLLPEYRMRQTIGVNFLRVRERDPNLLALAAACRMLRHARAAADTSAQRKDPAAPAN